MYPMSETGHLGGFLLCSHNCDFPMVMVLLQTIEIWLNFPEADDCMFIFVVVCSKAFGTISKSFCGDDASLARVMTDVAGAHLARDTSNCNYSIFYRISELTIS